MRIGGKLHANAQSTNASMSSMDAIAVSAPAFISSANSANACKDVAMMCCPFENTVSA
jgi:hypothetical protein